MGRGGGGGGSHGGGFSSGGSHGGSFRSSSGGSRSHSTSSGRGYSSVNGYSWNRGPSYGYRRTYNYGGGTRLGCFPNMVLGIFLSVVCLIVIVNLFNDSSITKSTIEREPLDKQYVDHVGDYFEDNIGWIRSSSKLIKGLKEFYNETGVAPYLVLTEDVDGNYHPSGKETWNYGEAIYQREFSDEGHMVFVFQCRDESSDYTMAAVTGAQAKTVVDDEALEILYDYIDSYFYSDRTEDELFADAFADAADRMMHKTTNPLVYVVIGIVVITLAITGYMALKAYLKRKKEAAEETERILNTPVDKIE